MKKIIAFLFLLTLLSSLVIAGEPVSEPIRFGIAEAVYGIDAVYKVGEKDAQSLEVTVAESLRSDSYLQWNYKNGSFRLSVACAYPLDLSDPLANVTAVLPGGVRVSPKLTLDKLYFDGKAADSNMVATGLTAEQKDSGITLTVTAKEDLPGSKFSLFCALYAEDGRMLAVSSETAAFESKSETFNVTFPDIDGAVTAKAFFLSEGHVPVGAALSTEIE